MDEQTLRKVVKEVVNEAVEFLKEDISTLKGSVLNIEQTITSYADSYKINQHNIERVDTRLTAVEDKLEIDASEELKVTHFASK